MDPDAFQSLAADLMTRGSETLDFLVARGYPHAPPSQADAAVDFLLASPRRLQLGYMSELSWASREMIAWATTHCSDQQLGALLENILNHYSEYEQSANGLHARGHGQYVLLSGIPTDRLTPEAAKRLRELERKFGTGTVSPPRPIEAFVVGSPIPQPKAELMNDTHWIGAMKRHNSDWGESMGPEGGGAVQLSRVLAEVTATNPQRFVALMERAPDDINPEYFAAVTGVVADPSSGADVNLVAAACRRAHSLPSRPCGRAICHAAQQRAQEGLPAELIELVSWYALHDPDPEEESWERRRLAASHISAAASTAQA